MGQCTSNASNRAAAPPQQVLVITTILPPTSDTVPGVQAVALTLLTENSCSPPYPRSHLFTQQQQAAKPAASVVKHDNPISPLDQHNSQPAGSQIPAASAGAPLAVLSARSASLNAARPSFAMTYELKEKLGKGQVRFTGPSGITPSRSIIVEAWPADNFCCCCSCYLLQYAVVHRALHRVTRAEVGAYPARLQRVLGGMHALL